MTNPNPYRSSGGGSLNPAPTVSPNTNRKWAIIGFFVGASIPISFAAYNMYSDSVYYASLPEDQRIMCGMGTIGAMVLIFIGAPLVGGIGSIIGLGLSRFNDHVAE